MIYIVVLFILLYGSIHYNAKNKDIGNKYLYFEYIVVVLVIGLRYKVGGDTLNYFYAFPDWPTLDKISQYDFNTSKYSIGWIVFSALCKYIYDDFVCLQFVEAAIVNASFFYFFKKNTDRYFIAILLYGIMFLFTYNTEIMRAAMSVSVFLFSFESYKRKKWITYYALGFVAFSFHSEAIVMFILPLCYLLSKIKITIVNLAILLIVSVATVSFFNAIPQLANLLSVSNQMSMMFELYSQETVSSNTNGYIAQILLLLPWLYMLWLSRNDNQVYWRGFIILYIFFTFQQLRYMVFMNRACDMLYPFLIVAIVDTMRRVSISKNTIIHICFKMALFIVVTTRVYNYMGNEHWKLFIPYSTILSPQENIAREKLLFDFQNEEK